MTFKLRSLSLHASVPFEPNKGIGFYKYATVDSESEVLTAGYFNDAGTKLNKNDVIDAVCASNATGTRISVIVTSVPETGDVTVAVNTDAAGDG